MGPTVNETRSRQGSSVDLFNLANLASSQQTDSDPTVTVTSTENKIPTTSKRNIVIRAFKFLADRIVAAVKFVWNKLFSSKSETDKKQQPQAMDDSKNSLFTGATNQDNFLLNQNPTIYEHPDNNLVSVEQIPTTNTEQSTVENNAIINSFMMVDHDCERPSLQDTVVQDRAHDNQRLVDKGFKAVSDACDAVMDNFFYMAAQAHDATVSYLQVIKETREGHDPVLVGQELATHTEQQNTETDTSDFELVGENIEHPDPVETYTYNRVHNNQQLVHQGIELVTAKLSDACDAVMDKFSSLAVTAYGSFIPYLQVMQRDMFNGKQLKEDMGSYISNFIEATDRNDDAPNDCVKEMIKFTDNELKQLLCDQIDIHYKDLKTVDKLVKIYAMLNYTTDKLNTNTDSNSKPEENLIQLNNKLNNIYKSCFVDFTSYLQQNEIIATTREAADALNAYLGKIFGSKYKPLETKWD